MYDEYQVSLPGVKQLGHGIDHPHTPPPILAQILKKE